MGFLKRGGGWGLCVDLDSGCVRAQVQLLIVRGCAMLLKNGPFVLTQLPQLLHSVHGSTYQQCHIYVGQKEAGRADRRSVGSVGSMTITNTTSGAGAAVSADGSKSDGATGGDADGGGFDAGSPAVPITFTL